ncbi:hypothetical protein [Sandaracinus amylolyticus]|uniref:PPM-type phosphatase domain-containing protein n=1 Tax=Sandaracinus amylolyticus TaxID=927083 RepID=A0A0F6YP07_9BACT|nr:hypothetical protein [Sandaracinus amylolyticus]AKF10957.1 hypothetical protein DB32_008106 [Sandaracinus amylolyticus]
MSERSLHRVHRYVGPPEIAAHARTEPAGAAITSGEALERVARTLDRRGVVTTTYVVDLDGVLRIADRSSEHVACAGGRPVLAAGELEVSGSRVVSATNLSTGYCPEAGCWSALAEALDRAGIARPSAFAHAFEMRRCVACGARQVTKDGELECVECGAALAARWNFDAVRWRRAWCGPWMIDVVEAPTSRDEDRVEVAIESDRVRLALSDGAGGTAHGASAALRVARIALDREDPATAIARADAALASVASGEATAVVIDVELGATALTCRGASAGDSRAWIVGPDRIDELTATQRRKPLVGSGRAVVAPFAGGGPSLLVASDGLDAPESVLARCVREGGDALGWALVDAVRLPSGALRDDVSAIVIRRA